MAERGTLLPGLWLALRSLLWTVLLPGMVAGFIPWRYFGVGETRIDWESARHLTGVVAIAGGVALLAACIFEFGRSGRGTLSPADPPRELVVRGLYRYVRNPMYLAVTAILGGELLLRPSGVFAWYAIGWFIAVNLFVIGYEEPTLRRQFGESYERYTKEVGRWLPTFRARA
jgi:protein-S-isoprenylcysteine O-methyltransferase Ste14